MVVPPVAFRREIDRNLSDFFRTHRPMSFDAPSRVFAATTTSGCRASNGTSTSITARPRARLTKTAASISSIPRTGSDAASTRASGCGSRPSIMRWAISCSGPMPSARPTPSNAGWCWAFARRLAARPKPSRRFEARTPDASQGCGARTRGHRVGAGTSQSAQRQRHRAPKAETAQRRERAAPDVP